MKKTITLTETELKNLIKESVNNILKEYDIVQWQHFNNGPTNKEMFNDAVEAIEMSDGQIDFDEWYPAFQDYIDYDEAEEIWVKALKHCGYSGMLYNENKLNEISKETAFQATDKANSLRRYNQANTFDKYGTQKLNQELDCNDDYCEARRYGIVYYNTNRSWSNLTVKGLFYFNNGGIGEPLQKYKETGIHNTTKPIARKIAKWCSIYLDDSYNFAKDWHFWTEL